MKRITLVLVFLAFLLKFGFAQDVNLPSFITDSLDKYIENSLEIWNVPAVAVGIVKDGKVIYEKAFGVKQVNTKNKVDENTLFMIGSNTKAFTGMALTLLEHQGKCSLNDKVIKWLPKFKLKDPAWTAQATLTDIITHRLGFETFQGDFMSFDSDLTEDQLLEKFGEITPMYQFRTKWGYCNAGYMMAGKCIESITGESWENNLKAQILNPLTMNNTVISVNEMKKAKNRTIPHSIDNHKLVTIEYGGLDLVGPAGSISSSINDMNKWTLALLDSGNFEGVNVIPQKVIQRTRKPESVKGFGRHAYNRTNYELYGLGWGLSDYEGYNLVAHTGGVHGYLSSVSLVPEANLGVVVLTNSDQNWLFVALKWEIIDAFLELPYRNYSENWGKAFKQNYARDSAYTRQLVDSTQMNFKPELSLKKFAGTYENEVYGYAELKAEKDYLVMTLEHHPKVTGKIEYIGNKRFLCTYSSAMFGTQVFPFNFDEKGVESFTLSVNSFWEFTTYNFYKINK